MSRSSESMKPWKLSVEDAEHVKKMVASGGAKPKIECKAVPLVHCEIVCNKGDMQVVVKFIDDECVIKFESPLHCTKEIKCDLSLLGETLKQIFSRVSLEDEVTWDYERLVTKKSITKKNIMLKI